MCVYVYVCVPARACVRACVCLAMGRYLLFFLRACNIYFLCFIYVCTHVIALKRCYFNIDYRYIHAIGNTVRTGRVVSYGTGY